MRQYLIDPGYDVHDLPSLFRRLKIEGKQIGLHQSFESWHNPASMQSEKERVQLAADIPIKACRQHWLNFSWEHTWRAQADAGLQLDMTLGFNDRPGFRNSAALLWQPWDFSAGREMNLKALPMVIMDSHLYDYHKGPAAERWGIMEKYIREVKLVGGTASIIWHPHTLSNDYGWQEGFERLLGLLRTE